MRVYNQGTSHRLKNKTNFSEGESPEIRFRGRIELEVSNQYVEWE